MGRRTHRRRNDARARTHAARASSFFARRDPCSRADTSAPESSVPASPDLRYVPDMSPGATGPVDPAALAAAYREHVEHVVRAYAAAAERAGLDAIAIHSGAPALVNRFDDRHHPLSQTPAFTHVIPL